MDASPKWKKISSKKYQVELEDGWKDIFVPYGKVELIVKEFFSNGGMVDRVTGAVTTDITVLVASFGGLGDILLSTYDDKGEPTDAVSCRGLSYEEVPELFKIAMDVITNFMQVVSAVQESPAAEETTKS